MSVVFGPFSIDKPVRAVEKVKQRLLRAASSLESARLPYAIAGGHAVALWVSRVDETAVRNTRDVHLLIRREDLASVRKALEAAGFVYRHSAGVDLFVDGPGGKPREGVHVIFANEKVRPHEHSANPDVNDAEQGDGFRVLSLPALVQIKLTAFRDKDRVHLRDLIDVGLVDASWLKKLPKALADRLKELLDNPE
jgi:hypothetical protein